MPLFEVRIDLFCFWKIKNYVDICFFFCLKFEKLRLKNDINCKIFTLGHCQNQRMFIKDCNLLLFTVEREQKRDYYSLVKKSVNP